MKYIDDFTEVGNLPKQNIDNLVSNLKERITAQLKRTTNPNINIQQLLSNETL